MGFAKPRWLASIAVVALWPAESLAAPSSTECLDASERAQVLRDQGELRAASDLFAVCSASACPALVQSACVRWRQATLASMPSAVIVVRNEREEDVLGAEYSFDAGKVAGRVSGHPIALDPGAHSLSVRAEGYPTVEQTVILSQGEKDRLVRIRLAHPGAPPIVPPIGTPAPVKLAPPTPPLTASPSYRVPLGIGLAVVAGGSLLGSIALGLSAKNELARLEDSPCGVSRTCDEATAEGLRTRLVVADVLLGTAIVTGLLAAWVWLSGPKSAVPARAALVGRW